MKKEIREKIIEILREYSCWTLKKGYGCIPELTDQILELLAQKKKKWVEGIGKILPPESGLDTIFEKGRDNAIQEIKQKLKKGRAKGGNPYCWGNRL